MQGHRTLRQTSIALSLVAVLALVAAACGGDDDDQPAGNDEAGVPATAEALQATTWVLTSYADNKTGDLTAASATSVGTAKFDGRQVAGSTGCNQFSGSYTLGADGAISFGPMATTRMACNADLTAQEQGFLDGLTAARQAVVADKALQLLNDKEDTILLFSPPKGAVLEGASWNVLNYRTPTAVTSSILGADITMQFAGDTSPATPAATTSPRRTRAVRRAAATSRSPTISAETRVHDSGRRRPTRAGIWRRTRIRGRLRDRRHSSDAPRQPGSRRRAVRARRSRSAPVRIMRRATRNWHSEALASRSESRPGSCRRSRRAASGSEPSRPIRTALWSRGCSRRVTSCSGVPCSRRAIPRHSRLARARARRGRRRHRRHDREPAAKAEIARAR